MSKKTINVPILTRVEGEGALELDIQDNKIESLVLRIFEPPRFFEKFLEGRSYSEVMDIVARICGICPIAYQMSAAHAIESVFGIETDAWVREMRRLFYCGEWLQSHSLHIHLLASPDFLGFDSAIAMAQKYPEEVKRGMRLQALGNEVITFLGGRSVHPVGACIGGFYHAPSLADAENLLKKLKNHVQDAVDLISWVASLPIPSYSHDTTFVSLRHSDEYPLNEGRLASSDGLDISISDFDNHFKEFHAPQSTALHCLLNNKPYIVGPLSRLNLNYDLLPAEIHTLTEKIGLSIPNNNIFNSITARAIELYYSILEAIRILENYSVPKSTRVQPIKPKAGVGFGCTEAPRGICWHRYEFDEKGFVKSSRIVPPTSQNQSHIEEDLKITLEQFGLNKTDDELRLIGEMVIRNYDPCISCSVHFLNLRVNRS